MSTDIIMPLGHFIKPWMAGILQVRIQMLREVFLRSHSQEIASTGPAKLFSHTRAWKKGHVPLLGQEGRGPGTGILVGFHHLQGGS